MDQIDPSKRVVVCGGGVIGVCTAYFLSKKGAAVTLIEKSSIACAASGKAAGFLALEMCDDEPIRELARASYNLHRLLAAELDGPQSYGYRPITTLSFSITESEAPGNPNPEVPVWVDGPAKSPKTIGTTETTAQLHPQLFCRTVMSRAVTEYGAKVVIGKMESVGVVEGGRVGSVVLEGGRVIEADAVVLALGPWSNSSPLLSSLFRVCGFKVNSLVLEPKQPDVFTAHGLFLRYNSAQDGNLITPWVYPRPTGEVYISGVPSEDEGEIPEEPEEIKADGEWIQVLKTVARTVSRHLGVREGEAKVKVEHAGFIPCTDDKVPVIGQVPGVKECYVATGHYYWGIQNGPATGAALAELVIDGHATIVDLTRFSVHRFIS